MIRKSITLLYLLIPISSYAASSYVTIPNLEPGFALNATILYLKPAASNLNYVINNKGLPLQAPTWHETEIRPSFTPAFALGATYNFSSDVGAYTSLNWTNLNSFTNTNIAADNLNYFLGPDYEIGPVGIPIRKAYGNVHFLYDVINLDFGQHIAFGDRFSMRFFGSISTAALREKVVATYTGNTTGTYSGPFSTQQTVQSYFLGVGPRAGLGGQYQLPHKFGICGEFAGSALIGGLHSKTSYMSSAQKLLVVYGQTQNFQTITDQRVYQVIPALEGNLAVNFTHAFSIGVLGINLGWQAAVFINAISQYIPASLVANEGLETGGIFVATMSHTLSNYSVQGPFLNFTFKL